MHGHICSDTDELIAVTRALDDAKVARTMTEPNENGYGIRALSEADRVQRLAAERDAARAESERLGKELETAQAFGRAAINGQQLIRDGLCTGTIGDGFVACGEGRNYCSAACQLRAKLESSLDTSERVDRELQAAQADLAREREVTSGLDEQVAHLNAGCVVYEKLLAKLKTDALDDGALPVAYRANLAAQIEDALDYDPSATATRSEP